MKNKIVALSTAVMLSQTATASEDIQNMVVEECREILQSEYCLIDWTFYKSDGHMLNQSNISSFEEAMKQEQVTIKQEDRIMLTDEERRELEKDGWLF